MNKSTMYFMIAISSLVIALYSMSKIAYKHFKRANTLEATITDMDQRMQVETIRLNDSIELKMAEVKALKVTYSNIESKYSELLKASDTKKKYVNTITVVSTVTEGRDTVVCLVDTFGGLTANFKDQYADISVKVDSERVATIDYSVKDSLTVINYQKRHSILFGLIKWNSYEGTKVVSNNPKSRPASLVTYSTIK